MKIPYIGICDFETAEQVVRMREVLAENQVVGAERMLMAGVMMSYKTSNGFPTKWSNVFPRKERVNRIFSAGFSDVLNTLHYADYDGVDVADCLERATVFGGTNMNAIQLDMIWPDPGVVGIYKEKHPDIRIVLQVGANAFDKIGNNPENFLAELKRYGGALDYALLDKSMGRGLGMDASWLMPFVDAAVEALPELGIAVAGGLGPDTLHLVEPLARKYRFISIDSQGRLRPSGSALDPIDWSIAENYLRRYLEMLRNI